MDETTVLHDSEAPAAGPPPYRSAPSHPPGAAPRRALPFRPRELAVAIAIVLLSDLALWSGQVFASGGFGAALLFLGAPIVLFAGARVRRRGARLGAVAAMLALVAVRSALDPTVLTTLAGLAAIPAFAFALRARRPFVPAAIASALGAIAKLPWRLASAFLGVRAILARSRLGRVPMLPILVPVALSVLFAGIFALANPLVAEWLGLLLDALLGVGLPSIGRVFTWGLASILGVALARPVVRLATRSEAASDAIEATPIALLVARNTLGALNVLFLAYNMVDAVYLLGGRAPAGMTTQEYAHQGAFWLTVALAALTVVVGVLFRGALAHDARAKVPRLLAYAWMAQGLVLALGTYRRIAIHVASSGLSNLRIVGILGTTLVLVGVILVARKLFARRSLTWLIRRQLDAFAVVAVLYAVAPTHWIAAHVNVARISGGEYAPLIHMHAQSGEVESATVLLPLLDHPHPLVRRGVAAYLDRERDRLRRELRERVSWREHDLLAARTLGALDDATPRIRATLEGIEPDRAIASLTRLADAAFDGAPLPAAGEPALIPAGGE